MFPDKALAGLEKYLSKLEKMYINSVGEELADVKALIARLKAAEAVIYSGLDKEDVKKAKLDAWRKSRGL